MSKAHEILKLIPHERIKSDYVRKDERFDVFKLGVFPAINGGQPVEEIVELVELQAMARYRPHYHEKSSAVIYMVLGEGVFLLGDREIPYRPGQRIDISAKKAHGFLTKSKTLFLSIQSPPIRNRETGEVDLHYAQEE